MPKDTTTHRKGTVKWSGPTVARNAKHRRFVGDYEVLGTTKDGVKILKPKGRPTHFTEKELRDAIAVVRSAQKTG